MNQNRTILRQWLGAVLGAVIIAVAVPATAWGQETPVQQGVRAGSNIATVNSTDVTAGQVVSAGRGTTVTVTTTDRTGESTPKVAKVTVTKKEDFLAAAATITGSETVNKNGTTTLTATVTPSFANTVVWTVTAGTGSAEFVTGETTTATTVTSIVDATTGTTTATLKGLEAGTVTVDVKATGDAAATLNETAKTVTVLNVPYTITTAPTATSAAILVSSTNYLVTTGSASGGTMMYAVTTDNTQPDKSAFSSTRPNANRATGRYYVWYYVKGDDSHIDSEISSTAIQVLVINTQGHLSSPNNPTYFTITADINNNNDKFWLVDGGKTMVISSTSKTIYKVELYVNTAGNYTLSPSAGTWSTIFNGGYLGVVSNVNSNSLTISGSGSQKTVSGIQVWYY